MKKISYDVERYNFFHEVKQIFSCEDLCYLHKLLPKTIVYSDLHKLGEDNKTWFHRKFYKPINSGGSSFQALYEDFIFNEVVKHFEFDKFLYQRVPTFRVQAPNNVAVGGWHRDRDYNHSPYEINFYVPLTIATDSSTIWVESEEDKGDYSPMNGDVGNFFIWNGANLKHGNKVNLTGKTRVSIDFRILPMDRYNPKASELSVSAGKKFIIGDYFKLKE